MELSTFGGSISASSISICLAFLILVTSISSSSGLADSVVQETLCDLSHCWELYQTAQESLRIHDDYSMPKLRTISPEEVVLRCVAFRTFFLCLRNMSRSCLGDLNFHSAHKGIEKQMKIFNCSITGRIFEPTNAESRTHMPVCSFLGNRETYRYCSIFGDPHIRTFDNVYQTCRIQGAWPLIDNEYFAVQVTSERVGTGDGTAISKVTVIIKRQEDCALEQYVSYQASSNELPSTFDDGQMSFGRSDSVTIREVKANSHIEIYIRYVDTTVVLRLINRYFTVSLRMPEEIVNETLRHSMNPLQLCSMGCPVRERVDIQRFLFPVEQKSRRTPMMTVETALPICQESGLVDYYLKSCVFDLVMTGDFNFTTLSQLAYVDAVLLLPSAGSMLDNRTTLSSDADHLKTSLDSTFYLLALVTMILLIARTIFPVAIV